MSLNIDGNIAVGLSGFRFDGDKYYYPKGLDPKRYIEFYSQKFDIVEINSTYYGLPQVETFERFARLTSDKFRFTVKVPASITHERSNPQKDLDKFKEILIPLRESGKLIALLAQFPFEFKPNRMAYDYLLKLNEFFPDTKIYIEFRHIDWIKPVTFDFLRANNFGIVSVDEPNLPGLLPHELWETDNSVYLRLHSRNAEKWFEGRDERYDYYYSDNELQELMKNLDDLSKRKLKALVFFNNCHQGSAAKNAEKLRIILGQETGIYQTLF